MMLQDTALRYQDRGWSVIPIFPRAKYPCVKWKCFQTQQPSKDKLLEWFTNQKDINLAVILGKVSGNLRCRDFDSMKSYEEWASSHHSLAASLPTVETARPGRHVYFRAEDSQFSDLCKSDPSIRVFEDGELKVRNGYCLLPPSIHPSGLPYRWLQGENETEIPYIDLPESGLLPPEKSENETQEVFKLRRDRSKAIISAHTGYRSKKKEDKRITKIFLKYIPSDFGTRRRNLFLIAQELKIISLLKNMSLEDFTPYLSSWYKLALPNIRTKNFNQTLKDFSDAWNLVLYPFTKNSLQTILEHVKTLPLPELAYRYKKPKFRLMISFCQELQRISVGSSFFLSCRKLGEILEISYPTASRWLTKLVEDGFLLLVTNGNYGTGLASEYTFIGA